MEDATRYPQRLNSRYSLYPILHNDLWGMYKQHVACFWTVEELDLSHDYADFESRLSPPEQAFIKNVLAFFSFGDGVVMENLYLRFIQEVEIPEARQFYAVQGFSEAIHAETYALLLQTLVRDETERKRLFSLVDTCPTLTRKAEWMQRYMASESEYTLTDRLVAYACVEGIFFSSSFASIFWLKVKNVCEGLCKSNEFISRDEGLHRDFACLLYTKMRPEGVEEKHRAIIREAVVLETEFMQTALDVTLLGMDATLMATYIEFVADHLSSSLGLGTLYRAQNPFEWMTMISLTRKSNFFESRVSEYAVSRMNESSVGRVTFTTNEDF